MDSAFATLPIAPPIPMLGVAGDDEGSARQSRGGGEKASEHTASLTTESATILGCVERSFGILGESAKDATFYFIEWKGGLKRHEIPDNPERLVGALRMVFGMGARELLRSILEELRTVQSRLTGLNEKLRSFADSIERGLRSVENGIS
jgi:hypothetical protein